MNPRKTITRIKALAAAQRLSRAGEHEAARQAFAALGISYVNAQEERP